MKFEKRQLMNVSFSVDNIELCTRQFETNSNLQFECTSVACTEVLCSDV